jgi:XTP/dITP diphosphohydrolase
VARAFAADVRAAEQAAKTGGVDPATMSPEDWRRFWPADADSAATTEQSQPGPP